MKTHFILFYILNAVFIRITRASVCRAPTTTISPYFVYYKCSLGDSRIDCENCDEYQPSCNSDSDCGNGQACCETECDSCKQCQGI